jgi:4-diphosphocytidyl-2-C-methyl-D-erythritol kinase
VTSVTVRVPAKINLQLTIGPLRPDGYHDLVTVFQAVSLFDEVTVTPAERDSVLVAGEGEAEVPADSDNLALRAVRALREAVQATRAGGSAGPGAGGPVRVEISKQIPVAAGMAGGSADAAAAIVACDALWGTGLPAPELSGVAARIGSDVPFALLGGTAVGRGRGERLAAVPAAPARGASGSCHWVLGYADGHLSTPLVYKTLDQQRCAEAVPDPQLSDELIGALRSGDAGRLGDALSNDLQAPALSLFPALGDTLQAGRAAGALGALVSGSGPTCFFLAGDAEHASDLAGRLAAAGACRKVMTATGPVPGATVVTRGA